MVRTFVVLAVLITTTVIGLPAIETAGPPWIDLVDSARRATYIFVGELETKTGNILITRSNADGSERSRTSYESGTFSIEQTLHRTPGRIRIQPGQIKIQACWREPSKEQKEGSVSEPTTLAVGDRGVWFVYDDSILGCYVFRRVPPEGLKLVRLVVCEMDSLGLPTTNKERSESEAKWTQLKKRVWQRLYQNGESPLWTTTPGSTDSSYTI